MRANSTPNRGQQSQPLKKGTATHLGEDPEARFERLTDWALWRFCAWYFAHIPKLGGPGDEPTAFAVSLNDRRRHMNKGSLAAVAAELEPFFAEDAKRRQKLSIKARDEKGRATPVMAILPQVVQEKPAPVARNEAAKSVGVNDRYVQDAKKIKTEAPEVFERLKAGKMTLQDAKREVAKKPTDDWRKDERERQAKVNAGETVVANAQSDKNLICPCCRGS